MKTIKIIIAALSFMICHFIGYSKPIHVIVNTGERPNWWTGSGDGCASGGLICWVFGESINNNDGNWVDVDYDNSSIRVHLVIDKSNADFYKSILTGNTINLSSDVIPVHKDIVYASCGQRVNMYIPKGKFTCRLENNIITFTAPLLSK